MGVRFVTPNSYNARNVNSDGTLNNNNAYNGNYGVRPLWWSFRTSKPDWLKAATHPQRKAHPARMGKYRINDADALAVRQRLDTLRKIK